MLSLFILTRPKLMCLVPSKSGHTQAVEIKPIAQAEESSLLVKTCDSQGTACSVTNSSNLSTKSGMPSNGKRRNKWALTQRKCSPVKHISAGGVHGDCIQHCFRRGLSRLCDPFTEHLCAFPVRSWSERLRQDSRSFPSVRGINIGMRPWSLPLMGISLTYTSCLLGCGTSPNAHLKRSPLPPTAAQNSAPTAG
jgi:hypothetical protein